MRDIIICIIVHDTHNLAYASALKVDACIAAQAQRDFEAERLSKMLRLSTLGKYTALSPIFINKTPLQSSDWISDLYAIG